MKIHIAPYNPHWVALFEAERALISGALSGVDCRVDHIGSTSVPELAAKPVIDVLVGLNDERDLDKICAPMIASGYTYFRKYEPQMPYRRLFVKVHSPTEKMIPQIVDVGDPFVWGTDFINAVNIHSIPINTYHWTRHFAFREYLRAHPDIRDAYGELKQQLSQQEFEDVIAYNQAKDAFVKEVESQAVAWFQRQQPATAIP